MSALVRPLHGLLRRYWAALERLVTAAGLSGLLLYLLRGLPAYPPHWDGVLAAAVFGATLGSPALGYFLAVAAAAYPIYHVSLYLMALFLAVALLGQRPFINNLGGLLLTLAAPLLNAVYLAWLAPLLGGLWWGPLGGALIGGFAALWGQLLFGMTGAPPDWLINLGLYPDLSLIADRFSRLDSFDTLWLLVAPFVPDSTTLLYLLLQATSWAAVAAAVGVLAEKPWAQARRPLSGILLAWGGALALLGLQCGVALWLGAYTLADLSFMSRSLALTLAGAALAASFLEILHSWAEYPMAAAARRRRPMVIHREIGPAGSPPPAGSAQPVSNAPPDTDPRLVWPRLRRLFSRSAPAPTTAAPAGSGLASRSPDERLAPGESAGAAAPSSPGDDDRDDDLVMLEID